MCERQKGPPRVQEVSVMEGGIQVDRAAIPKVPCFVCNKKQEIEMVKEEDV